jgi:hypothetical protein
MLQWRKLDAYRYAVALLETASAVCDEVPRPQRRLADQLEGAALAVLRALAEAHHLQPDDRAGARYGYGCARGSCFDCVALLDTLERARAVSGSDAARVRELLTRVIGMVCRLEGEAAAKDVA